MNAVINVDSKRATTVVVELSRSRAPPILPFELKDHVSPNTWAVRMSALIRLASQYYRPTFERAYLAIILVLTFLVPIATYHVILRTLENAQANDAETKVWLARLSSVAITIAMWIVLFLPMVIWKYLREIRVTRLVDEWTRSDGLAGPSYGAAPVWKVTTSGLFRDAVVLTVALPLVKKSHFSRDSDLPPYIAASDDALPLYQNSITVDWSSNLKGGTRYGELPIYTDDKSAVVHV